jgi:hypothetical protein
MPARGMFGIKNNLETKAKYGEYLVVGIFLKQLSNL